MEMVFAEPQLPATPQPTTPITTRDLPPIGTTLRFTEDQFNCADEQVGNEVTVIGYSPNGVFHTTTNTGICDWDFHESDWREGLEIVKLPEA